MAGDTLHAVLYCRVSTEEQGRRGFSLAEQRRECVARAEAISAERGGRLHLTEFTDQASGEVLERPGLEACRQHLAQRQNQFFICLDPDRFSRSLNLQLLVAEEIEKRGTELVFVSHDYKRTPEGKLFFQLRGAIAEFEKAKILERTRRGRRGKLAAGGIPNHITTWGYRWNLIDKSLAIDESAAPWVHQIFTWYAAGWSYARIARQLAAFGVQPARGERWHRSSIMRIVRNSTYVGRLVLNRWDCEGNGPLRSIPPAMRPHPRTDRLRPAAQWVTVAVPAIIDQSLWEQAQTVHQSRTRLMQRGVGLLSGLCACGLCGGKIHYAGTPRRRYLRCRNRYADSPPASGQPCAWRDLPSAHVEEAVWQRITDWLADAAGRFAVRPVGADQPDQAQHLALLDRSLRAKRAEHRRMCYLYARGLAPDDAEIDLARLAEQVRTLAQERETRRRQPPTSAPDPDSSSDLGRDVRQRLGTLSLTQRQRLVRMLMQRVVVWPDGTLQCAYQQVGGSPLLQGRPTR